MTPNTMSPNKPGEKEQRFLEALQDSPVIAAIKDDNGLERVMQTECQVVFILYGSILNISAIVTRIKESGRMALVHIDLIEGLSSKEVSVDYIAECTDADGIISTRVNALRHAQDLGLVTIQRFFLLDSMALRNLTRQPLRTAAIDIMPGVMPSVISRLTGKISQPIIASGLLSTKQDVISALSAGALAVSTTQPDLWFV